jgi:hypothetical protein
MTGHRHRPPKRREPRCPRPNGLGKQRYRSPAKAKRAAIAERGKAGHPLYVYQCPRCSLWHLTGMSQSKGGQA